MKPKPHPWVENLVIGAALLLALIIAYFIWMRSAAVPAGVPPLPVERPKPVPPPRPLINELKGSGTTSELPALPSVRITRRPGAPRKIDVPSPDKR